MATEEIVLVTGGTGLVGDAIRYILENSPEACYQKKGNEKWVFLSSKDCDLRDAQATKNLFEKYKPTYVIHLAAVVGGLFKNMKYKLDLYRDNMLINDNVLFYSKEYNVKKVISCLSTCIFPDKTTYPIDETMVHNGPPHHSNFGYAYSKRMIDIQNKAYHEQYGCNFTSIVPCNIFGENDAYNLEDSHVIPGLIHKCYLAKKNNTPFIVSGSGKPLRQFIYSRDLAKLIIWTLREYNEIEPIILAVTEEITIKQVADAIVKHVGFEGEYKFDPSKADGQYKKTATNAKLMRLNPTFKFTDFDIAIKNSVEWFINNYDTCRK